MLVDINWNTFRTKFNNEEQSAFERLCYLLFCKEFAKDTGIFRFQNHAGIETDPIEKDGLSCNTRMLRDKAWHRDGTLASTLGSMHIWVCFTGSTAL